MLAEDDPRRGRSGRPWRRARARILIPGITCEWEHCPHPGIPIDLTLPTTDPWSATVDHRTELVDHGHPLDLDNLAALHRWCNEEKERRRRAALRVNPPRSRPTSKLRPPRVFSWAVRRKTLASSFLSLHGVSLVMPYRA